MGALDDGKMVFQTDIVKTMIQVPIKGREHEAALYLVLSGVMQTSVDGNICGKRYL